MTILSISFLAALVIATTDAAQANFARRLGGRKLLEPFDPTSVVDGQYIVVFDASVANVTLKAQQLFSDGQVKYEYNSPVLKGVSIQNTTPELLQSLVADPQILFIEQDVVMDSHSWVNGTKTQSNATIGLDRLDQNKLPLDGMYKYKQTGLGVFVYVIDKGLRTTHVEFEGRASCGFDAVLGEESNVPCEDLNGHGTHVTGLIGGKTYGVAKQVTLIGVKIGVAESQLTAAAFLAGIDYVRKQKAAYPSRPMIASMSVGGPKLRVLNRAVTALVNSGVTVVVAAGNDGVDACNSSPAGANGAITVGAMDPLTDEVVWWSNNGNCVDLYAPGVGIVSSGRSDDTRFKSLDGTSQSAPLVAGTVALYLETKPAMTPQQVWAQMSKDSLVNVLKAGPPGGDEPGSIDFKVSITNNRLLHTGAFTDKPPCPYTGRKAYMCSFLGWV